MRIGVYAAGLWTAVALILSLTILVRPDVPFGNAVLAAFPPSLLLGVIALAARYPCRAVPLRKTPISRVLATHIGTAVAASGLWGLAGKAAPDVVPPHPPLLFPFFVWTYDSPLAVHY